MILHPIPVTSDLPHLIQAQLYNTLIILCAAITVLITGNLDPPYFKSLLAISGNIHGS